MMSEIPMFSFDCSPICTLIIGNISCLKPDLELTSLWAHSVDLSIVFAGLVAAR